MKYKLSIVKEKLETVRDVLLDHYNNIQANDLDQAIKMIDKIQEEPETNLLPSDEEVRKWEKEHIESSYSNPYAAISDFREWLNERMGVIS